jgi:RsiW-degrading membrane proteinase PrsW (M82 family)
MTYGAVLSAVLSAVLATALVAYAAKDRRRPVLVTTAAAALVMPLFWNTVLRVTGATAAFSHDLPFRPFPISWQDTGSGVFTLAGAAIALGLLTATEEPSARTARLALWTALAALLIDIYLY